MKKTRRARIAALLGCAFLLWTLCAGVAPVMAADLNVELTEVTIDDDEETVYFEAVVELDEDVDIEDYGFRYRVEGETWDTEPADDWDEDGDEVTFWLELDIDDFDEDEDYEVEAYVIDDEEEQSYSDEEEFNIEGSGSGDEPSVSTDDADVDGTEVTLFGTLEDLNGEDLLEYGFYYGEDEDDMDKVRAGYDDIDEDDEFEYDLDDLDEDTKYYYKAYARTSEGTGYGDVETFTTDDESRGTLATLEVKVNDISANSATVVGTLLSNGGGVVSEYGFYYGPAGGAQQQVRFFGSINPNVPFQYYLGVTPGTYTVRSYAITGAGIAYSQPFTFTASGTVVTPPVGGPTVPAGKAPVVLVSTPAQGMTINRGQTVEIASSSTDDVKVEAMGLYINGDKKFRCTGSSFQYYWSTAGLAPGVYNINITSWDGVLVGQRTISVTVR